MWAGALALRVLLTPLTGRGAPFVIFFGAVFVASLLAGTGPALLCLVLSLPVAVRLYILPQGYSLREAAFQALLYSIDGLVIIAMTAFVRVWEQRLRVANQKLYEASLARERAFTRTRETIELAPDAYFLADLSARFTDVNQAACKLLGFEREELLGKTIFDLIHPEDAARLNAQRDELLVPGTVLTNEWALARKDGTFVPVEVSANILQDGRWQAFVRDISERMRITKEREEALSREQLARRQAEATSARLRESEERFRLTIEEAPIGMALVALDGRFVRVNHVLCEITGYSAAEMIQLSFQDITHPDDLAKDLELARQLAAGDIPRYQLEKRYIRKDRSVVIVLLSASILRAPSGDALYYIVRIEDITARKRAEEALRISEEALRRAVAARDDMLAVVAHDLRNPLGTILMTASLLERPAPEPERRSQEARHIIERSARRMNRLIQDLLDVTMAEAGQLKVERRRMSSRDLVREVVDAQTPLAAASEVQLTSKVPNDLPDIDGDHDRLLQVFENLIGNAIKFTQPGGTVTVSAAVHQEVIRFSVADSGAGISPESLPHIFDRFWQDATEQRRRGAGLGLPIARGIVVAHGGRIWAESAVGRGTTFYFTIPVASPKRGRPLEARGAGREPGRRVKH